jgi:hypothetical protein
MEEWSKGKKVGRGGLAGSVKEREAITAGLKRIAREADRRPQRARGDSQRNRSDRDLPAGLIQEQALPYSPRKIELWQLSSLWPRRASETYGTLLSDYSCLLLALESISPRLDWTEEVRAASEVARRREVQTGVG